MSKCKKNKANHIYAVESVGYDDVQGLLLRHPLKGIHFSTLSCEAASKAPPREVYLKMGRFLSLGRKQPPR